MHDSQLPKTVSFFIFALFRKHIGKNIGGCVVCQFIGKIEYPQFICELTGKKSSSGKTQESWIQGNSFTTF